MKHFSITDRKLIVYIASVVAIVLNILKLLSLRENAVIPHLWKFNLFDLLFQIIWNFLFCIASGVIIVRYDKLKKSTQKANLVKLILQYAIALIITQAVGVNFQKYVLHNSMPLNILRLSYFVRLLASLILVIALIRIFKLAEEKKLKQQENEKLRNEFLNAQLQVLKDQLNPHFFFNTLSSLSAVVRENPKKAQQYIAHLSKIFHYSLDVRNKTLVMLKDELAAFASYTNLIYMRFEENVVININIDTTLENALLPHMSLQPLVENAIKHNIISASDKLNIDIYTSNNQLVISNNLQPLQTVETSTGIGLANLNERYRILTGKEISITKSATSFTVSLPLKPLNEFEYSHN